LILQLLLKFIRSLSLIAHYLIRVQVVSLAKSSCFD